MRTVTQNELDEILAKHKAWLNGEDGGERANLSRADLSGAYLYRADLYGANLNNITCRQAKGIMVFYGPDYQVTVTQKFIKIGCKEKTRPEWLQVTEDEAVDMGLERENYALYREFIEILPEEYHS